MNTYAVYEVNQAISDCLDFIEEREAEIFEEIKSKYGSATAKEKAHDLAFAEGKDTLDILKMEKEDMIYDMVDEYRNIQALVRSIGEEEKMLKDRKSRAEARLETTKKILFMMTDGKKRETGHFKISFRKNQSTRIDSMDEIPEKYKTAVLKLRGDMVPDALKNSVKEYTADKTAIKNVFKGGGSVPGATMVESVSMTVK